MTSFSVAYCPIELASTEISLDRSSAKTPPILKKKKTARRPTKSQGKFTWWIFVVGALGLGLSGYVLYLGISLILEALAIATTPTLVATLAGFLLMFGVVIVIVGIAILFYALFILIFSYVDWRKWG
jgi:hypothetical protein